MRNDVIPKLFLCVSTTKRLETLRKEGLAYHYQLSLLVYITFINKTAKVFKKALK